MRILFTLLMLLAAALLCAAETPEADLNAPVDSLERNLQEIVVTADRPMTKMVGNTLVSAVAGTPLENVGTALDVLAQLPLITVTDGTVDVTGKGAPEIYIDGRPMRDSDRLEQLMSSDIRNVELNLAPGAIYSAETQAVIRITTRRRFIRGLSLTDRTNVEKKRRWSASDMLDLNLHMGAWDIFLTGTVGHYDTLIKGSTVNTFLHYGQPVEIGSSQRNSFPTTVGTLRGGVNFSDGNLSAGAYYRFNPERGRFVNHGSEWISGEEELRRSIFRHTDAESHLVSAYIDQKFDGGARLHFDGDFRTSDSHSNVSTAYPDGQSQEVDSRSHRTSRLAAGKLYAEFPAWQGVLTAGLQGSYTRSMLDFTMDNADVASYIPTMKTESSQTVAAAFASWARTVGRLRLEMGVRYEYTDYCLDAGDPLTKVIRKDHSITPDITLGYDFNDDTRLSLTYRTATLRPPYSQLTGSLEYVGRHEIEGGNAALRDERMHSVQLFGSWHGLMLQSAFTRSLDTYGFVKRLIDAPSLQLILQPVNMDVSALDIYLTWSRRVRAWTPAVTLGTYRQWLQAGGTRQDGGNFAYYIDNTFSLPHGFLVTANAWGRTAGPIHTNRFGANPFSLDLSVSRYFLGKALQVKVEATDIFNTLNNDWSMLTYGVSMSKRQRYDRRGISLSVVYRLRPRQSSYKGNHASQAELERL